MFTMYLTLPVKEQESEGLQLCPYHTQIHTHTHTHTFTLQRDCLQSHIHTHAGAKASYLPLLEQYNSPHYKSLHTPIHNINFPASTQENQISRITSKKSMSHISHYVIYSQKEAILIAHPLPHTNLSPHIYPHSQGYVIHNSCVQNTTIKRCDGVLIEGPSQRERYFDRGNGVGKLQRTGMGVCNKSDVHTLKKWEESTRKWW